MCYAETVTDTRVRSRNISRASDDKAKRVGKPSPHRALLPELLSAEARLMLRIQSINLPGFPGLMSVLGEVCTGEGLVAVHASLYWVFSQYLCVYGIWLVPISEILNGLIKWAYRAPRPAWTHREIALRSWSHEYSFPSSHAQVSFSLACFAATVATGPLAQAAPLVLASLVAFSRVYEGLHWPHDIVAGALLGSAAAMLHVTFFVPQLDAMFASAVVRWDFVVVAEAAAAAMLAVVVGAHRLVRSVANPDSESWLTVARSKAPRFAERKLDTLDTPLADYVGMCGVLGGLALGQPLVVLAPIAPPRHAVAAALRMVLGSVLLFGLFLGLRAIEKKVLPPRSCAAFLARFFRYFAVPVIILQGAPFAFVACGL